MFHYYSPLTLHLIHEEYCTCLVLCFVQEKAVFYRQQLLQKLGLVAQGKVFATGVEKFIDDSDLMIASSAKDSPNSKVV